MKAFSRVHLLVLPANYILNYNDFQGPKEEDPFKDIHMEEGMVVGANGHKIRDQETLEVDNSGSHSKVIN